MPDFCTCGAQLAPDSLFCHKCGKPQRDIVTPEPPPAEVSAPAAPPARAPLTEAASPRLSVHDHVAVRIAGPCGSGRYRIEPDVPASELAGGRVPGGLPIP